eukprot:1551659-Rhodomonas_salina.3
MTQWTRGAANTDRSDLRRARLPCFTWKNATKSLASIAPSLSYGALHQHKPLANPSKIQIPSWFLAIRQTELLNVTVD